MWSTAIALWLVAATVPCGEATSAYESLDLERAVELADGVLRQDRTRPTRCLEIKGLSELLLQRKTAQATFQELFTRSPGYLIEDPSLSPRVRDRIEAYRRSVDAVSASVFGRWLDAERVRITFVIDGGGAAEQVRFSAIGRPSGERIRGEGRVRDRVATATVTLRHPGPIEGLDVTGVVVAGNDRIAAELTARLALQNRPGAGQGRRSSNGADLASSSSGGGSTAVNGPARAPGASTAATEPEPPDSPSPDLIGNRATAAVDAEGDDESGGVSWPVWVLIGVGVVGAGVGATILLQPALPDAIGTLGRAEVGR